MAGRRLRISRYFPKDTQNLVIDLVEYHGVTTIIVDALDECNLETRQTLLDALEDHPRDAVALTTILGCSRDDQDIISTLSEYPSLNFSFDKTTRDIEAFVRAGTDYIINKGRLLPQTQAKKGDANIDD